MKQVISFNYEDTATQNIIEEKATNITKEWEIIQIFVMQEYVDLYLKIEDEDLCH